MELPSSEWFGESNTSLTVHVIDSMRPYNLASLFMDGPNGERIIIWDDGGADKLQEERKAFEAIEVCNPGEKLSATNRVGSMNIK